MALDPIFLIDLALFLDIFFKLVKNFLLQLIGSSYMIHVIFSEQGSLVNEPLYKKNACELGIRLYIFHLSFVLIDIS